MSSAAPDLRLEAVKAASVLYAGARTPLDMLAGAGQILAWLGRKPARLVLTPAPFTFAAGRPGPGVPTHYLGDGMSVQMNDEQQVTYSVEAEDDKGFAVADTLTWSADDGGAVLTVTPSGDGMSATFAAVAPGTATITASDGNLSASDLITVTTGNVAALVMTPGAVEDQPPVT
jgi:hypothetical protein